MITDSKNDPHQEVSPDNNNRPKRRARSGRHGIESRCMSILRRLVAGERFLQRGPTRESKWGRPAIW